MARIGDPLVMHLGPGDIFETRYEVREELGANEYSVVYRATSTDNGRDVTVRLILAPPNGYPDGFDAKFIAESKRVSKLRHAGTVHLDSFGAAEDGTLYLVSEYVSGRKLADLMGEEEIAPRDVIGLIKRMAESLGEAHARGVIHREFKPANIAVPLRRGVLGAKLRDYGITKYLEQDGPLSAATVGFGSPQYMSPEQILGQDVGASSNIYSLGLVMYELLANKPAIETTVPREILAVHLSTTEFRIPRHVPPQLKRLLQKMIAKSQDDRFESTDELLDAISELDYSKLSIDAQVKAAKLVAKLKALDGSGGDAGDTVVGYGKGLDSDSEALTEETMRDRAKLSEDESEPIDDRTELSEDPGELLEDPTELSEDPTESPDDPTDQSDDEPTNRGDEEDRTMRQEVLTPTNVISDDDVTQLAEESDLPRSLDPAENEPTDELQDKTKPHRRRSRETRDEEVERPRKRKSRSDRRGKSRRRSSRSRSSRRSRSRDRDRDRGRDRERRRSDRDRDGRRKKRKKRREPEPEPDEDRVSWGTAIGAIVLAIVVALVLTGGVLWLKSALNDAPQLPPSVVASSKPIEPADLGASGVAAIPSVTMDLGSGPIMDFGVVPTGCGNAHPAGWTSKKQVVGLREVRYEAYVPHSYAGDPVPLILAVHPPGPPGMFGRKWAHHVRLRKIADAMGAIMLTPEDRNIRPWLSDLERSFADFDQILNHATATFCVDITQVVGIGMSTGAQALEQFACEHPDRFAALGLVAHWREPDFQCKGRPPATLIVNGLQDRVSPPAGGGGCFGRNSRLPIEEAEANWRKEHGCESPQSWATEPDGVCNGFKSCKVSDLVLCQVPEGVHGWPGSEASVLRCVEEFGEIPDLTDFPTTDLMRRFLKEQLK